MVTGLRPAEMDISAPPLTEDRIDEIARRVAREEIEKAKFDSDLLLSLAVESTGSPALIINEERAIAAPCKCLKYDEEVFCWTRGAIGLISSKKTPEDLAKYCPEEKRMWEWAGEMGTNANGMLERFKSFREAAHRAQERYYEIPEQERLWTDWLRLMGQELEKVGIEV